MNLDAMQDMLNALNTFFKVFVYPTDSQVILRVFHDTDKYWSTADFMDIVYDLNGNYISWRGNITK